MPSWKVLKPCHFKRSEKSCISCYTNIINIYARNDGVDFSLFARPSTANQCIFKSIQRGEIKLFRIVLVLSLIVIFTACSKSDDSSSNSTGTLKYRSTNIDRMICNWAGPEQSHTGVSKVQRQQLRYDTTNNVWKSTSNNITFAPTNDCNFDNSSYGTTTFGGSGASITNNLVDNSTYQTNFGSQPTKPSPTLE